MDMGQFTIGAVVRYAPKYRSEVGNEQWGHVVGFCQMVNYDAYTKIKVKWQNGTVTGTRPDALTTTDFDDDKPETALKTIDEHKAERNAVRAKARLTGIACPNCDAELIYPTGSMNLTFPPQIPVVCERCDWAGQID